MEEKVFYYKFNKLNSWLCFNIAYFIVILHCVICCPRLLLWPQTQVFVGAFVFSVFAWCYKYVIKHKCAVITAESIKIDHTQPLKWQDIESAEIRYVWCCFKKRKILVLTPKPDIDYKYNFLQKHNNPFTPFSIPLYGILSLADEQELTAIVITKVGVKIAD